MLVFRVENPKSDQGLWYTTKAEFNPIIGKLGLKAAELPMDKDPAVYAKDGIAWYSGCESLSDLYEWFSVSEMGKLREVGFKLMMYNSELVVPHYGHVIFSKQHLHGSQEVDLSLLIN